MWHVPWTESQNILNFRRSSSRELLLGLSRLHKICATMAIVLNLQHALRPGIEATKTPFYNGLLKSFLAVNFCCPAELESDYHSFNDKNCVENATG